MAWQDQITEKLHIETPHARAIRYPGSGVAKVVENSRASLRIFQTDKITENSMRKVKIRKEENGSFMVEGKESYPELKGKKLVILTKGDFSGTPDEGKEVEWQISGDEAIVMTEEEFESVRENIKSSLKGKK
ncbi:MAG: hypothetical protein AAGU11_22560 [Syntrophobacteraceae bacterium]